MPVCTYDIVLYCGRFCVMLAQRGSFGKAFCDPRSGRGSSVPTSVQGRLSPIFPQSFCAQAFAVRPQIGQTSFNDSFEVGPSGAASKGPAFYASGVTQTLVFTRFYASGAPQTSIFLRGSMPLECPKLRFLRCVVPLDTPSCKRRFLRGRMPPRCPKP